MRKLISEEKLDNSVSRGVLCTSFANAKRRGIGSLKIRISPLREQLSHPRPSFTLRMRKFRVIKGKEN